MNKLKGLPPIMYLNLDHRTDRKEHIEGQFQKWGSLILLGGPLLGFLLTRLISGDISWT